MEKTTRHGSAQSKSLDEDLIREAESLLSSLLQPLDPPKDFVHDLKLRLDTQPPARIVRIPKGFFSSILYIVATVLSTAILVAIWVKGMHRIRERWQTVNHHTPAAFTRGQA